MESLSIMDSAGSCDSVISANSAWSQDSMEHLSAEEKACLMYLEETIEALEVQEDSGLSNDEPDVWSKTEPQDQIRSNDASIEMLESGSHGITTPTTDTAAVPLSTGLTTESETEHHATNQNLVDVKEFKTEDPRVELDPFSDSGYTTSPSEKTTKGSKLDGDLENVSHSADASDTDLDIIPPPTDFMDEQDPDLPPETMDVPPPLANSFTKQKPTVDLEQMQYRTSLQKCNGSSSTAEDSSGKPPEVASLVSQMSPPPDSSEPRSPPAVAPKPKKLPANIFLKSQKTPTAVSHENPVHLGPTHTDRMLLDPQKVRIEALKKLGLLKDNKEESTPVVSPKLPPKSVVYRGSQASHSPPVSPASSHKPPTTPSLSPVNSPTPAPVLQQSVPPFIELPEAASASPHIQDAEILPAPAAFSDLAVPSGIELPAFTEAPLSTPPNTQPALLKQLSPPKMIGVKSATLERSGLGLNSKVSSQSLFKMDGDEQDPKHLRNTRPRPASLGSGKDFCHGKSEGLVASGASETQKPLPTQAFHHRASAKMPRSQGISVLICPRAENEEDRREALKKLGLLRD